MRGNWDLCVFTRVQKQTVISVSVSLVHKRKEEDHLPYPDEGRWVRLQLKNDRNGKRAFGHFRKRSGFSHLVQWLKHLKKKRGQRTVFWCEQSLPWASPCSGMEMASENRNRSCAITCCYASSWATSRKIPWKDLDQALTESFAIFLAASEAVISYFCSAAQVPHLSCLSFCAESWPKTGKQCQVTLHC